MHHFCSCFYACNMIWCVCMCNTQLYSMNEPLPFVFNAYHVHIVMSVCVHSYGLHSSVCMYVCMCVCVCVLSRRLWRLTTWRSSVPTNASSTTSLWTPPEARRSAPSTPTTSPSSARWPPHRRRMSWRQCRPPRCVSCTFSWRCNM